MAVSPPASAGAEGEEGRLTKIWKRAGTGRMDLDAAGAGDIVSVTGVPAACVADTLGGPELAEPLPPGTIEPPTLRQATCTSGSGSSGTEQLALLAVLYASFSITAHQWHRDCASQWARHRDWPFA